MKDTTLVSRSCIPDNPYIDMFLNTHCHVFQILNANNIVMNSLEINVVQIVHFRTPHYLIDDGTEAAWPQFDLDNQK